MKASRTTADSNAEHASLSYRTLSALFWSFSTKSVHFALRMISIVILARLLVPEDFGVVTASLTIIQFSEIFGLLGVGPAVVQRSEIEERHIYTGFTSSVLFGTLLMLLLWLLAPAIASFYQSERLIPVLRALTLVFPLSGLTVVAESLMQRELLFRKLTGIEVATYAIGNGIVGIGLAVAGFGVWSLVVSNLVQEVLRTIAILVVYPHTKKLRFETEAFKELFYFGGGLTVARVFNYLAVQGDNLVVGRYLGLAALGLYGRAYQLMTIPVNLFGSVLDRVMFPAMARVQDETERLVTSYRRGTALIALVILPMSIIAYILAPELVNVLLGSAWGEVVAPFRILVVGMLFRTSYKMSVSLARAKGAVYRNAWRQGIYATLIVGASWIGQHWGLAGVAFGVLITLAIHFLLMAQLGQTLIPFSWRQFWAVHLPGLWCALVVGVTVWGVATWMRAADMPALLVVGVCGGVALASVLILVRFVPTYFLGPDGIWVLDMVLKRFSGRLPFVTWLRKEVRRSPGPTQ